MQQTATAPLTGLCVTDTSGAIGTWQQLGGEGIVYNKVLAVPGHLGQPWHSLEYVMIPPCLPPDLRNSVGLHTQETDEIYFICAGTGELTTNGVACTVSEGNLIVAPRGTTHTIQNASDKHLTFLVVELEAPDDVFHEPTVLDLKSNLQPSPQCLVQVGQQWVPAPLATVNLADYLSPVWGHASLLRLPPGARVPKYQLNEDQTIFVVDGFAAIEVEPMEPFYSTSHGLNVVVPRLLPCRVTNQASGDNLWLTLFCLSVRKESYHE